MSSTSNIVFSNFKQFMLRWKYPHDFFHPGTNPFVIYQPVPDNLKFDDHIIGRVFVCFIEFVLAAIARLYLHACQEAEKGRVVFIEDIQLRQCRPAS